MAAVTTSNTAIPLIINYGVVILWVRPILLANYWEERDYQLLHQKTELLIVSCSFSEDNVVTWSKDYPKRYPELLWRTEISSAA